MTRARAFAAGALVAALAVPAGAWPAPPGPLLGAARCVSDYLEALAAAAPPRPRGQRRGPASTGDEARWSRARAHLAPTGPGGAPRLAPWAELGRDGAFLGYELVRVRRGPRGAAVVTALERTLRAPDAAPVTAACAYLTARMGGEWLVVDRRCGEDFSDADVLALDARWDEPEPPAPAPDPDESLPDDPE